MPAFRVAILTASDAGAAGQRADRSGKMIAERVEKEGWNVVSQAIAPDDRETISERLRRWADSGEVDLIVTTGGTGVGPRDVTPEATLDIAERLVPGIAEQMRAQTVAKTPMAMVSRQVVAIRGQTLIINLPGNPRGVEECLDIVTPVLPHTLQVLTEPRTEDHPA